MLPEADRSLVEQARALAERWLAMRGRGTESPAAIRRELGAVLDAEVGIFRDADGLARAAAVLDDLAERYRDVRVADTAAVFNTDWTQALELGAMLDVARGAVAAAIGRTESRGAHQRLDHPQTDDVARHSLVTLDANGAITVTWPPAVEPPPVVEPPSVVEPVETRWVEPVETTPTTRPARPARTPEARP